jgi:AcrR family transcriptional regulator
MQSVVTVKETILEAGLSLLRKRGVSALTQPQVAKAAGLKQSHLTYYFPTRTDLHLAIAEYTVDSILAELGARLEERPDEKTLAAVIRQNLMEGLPPRVLLGLIVAADKDPAIHEALNRLISHVRGALQSLLKKSGLASDDDAALMFHATMVGLAVMHHARQSPDSAHEIGTGIDAIIGRLRLADHSQEKG